ncbi:MAG: hypothetical protein ACHQNV_07175 [Vicinamibacteria bacterium]
MRMMSVSAGLAITLLLSPGGALAADRRCVQGTVYHGTARLDNVRVKLSSSRVEVATFTDANGAYRLCVEPGRYLLEIYWGRNVYSDPGFVVSRDESRDIHVESLARKTASARASGAAAPIAACPSPLPGAATGTAG